MLKDGLDCIIDFIVYYFMYDQMFVCYTMFHYKLSGIGNLFSALLYKVVKTLIKMEERQMHWFKRLISFI